MWLHSSVGRASHWYRGGHRFQSRWSPDFFQASSFQLLKLENLLRWSLYTFGLVYIILYNNPSYYRILIGSCLWSIRGQMHDWRHHYKVFPSAALKWRKVLIIRIIFYVTGQKIRYKKVLPRHWTVSRSQKTKDKAVSFRKWYRNNFLAASVGSRARLNHAQTLSW